MGEEGNEKWGQRIENGDSGKLVYTVGGGKTLGKDNVGNKSRNFSQEGGGEKMRGGKVKNGWGTNEGRGNVGSVSRNCSREGEIMMVKVK